MASQADVQSRLNALYAEFALLVRSIDQADAPSANARARAVLDGIRSLLDTVQRDLAADFTANRLTTYESDRATVASFDQHPPTRADIAALNRVAVNASRDLALLSRLLGTIYPKPPFAWKDAARSHWKKIAVVTAVVGLVVGGVCFTNAVMAKNHGLTASYFADTEFKALHTEGRVPMLDFSWGFGSALPGWRRSEFSVRWTGFIRIPKDGTWQFFTHADDGVRVFLADKLLIEDWNRHGTKINRAEVELASGFYPIKVEYFEDQKGAVMRLFWKPAGPSKPSIVPSTALVPSADRLPEGAEVFDVIDSSSVVHATLLPTTYSPEALKAEEAAKKAAKKAAKAPSPKPGDKKEKK